MNPLKYNVNTNSLVIEAKTTINKDIYILTKQYIPTEGEYVVINTVFWFFSLQITPESNYLKTC